ncbi:MAG: HEAT repeat domain-containing protein [Planctomycetota bacterium]
MVPQRDGVGTKAGTRLARWLGGAGLALVLAAGGCAPDRSEVTLTPEAQRELKLRALNLLLAAAESELDDLSCNAIEALTRIAPRDGLPMFRKATESASPIVRYAGFRALGDARDSASMPRMLAAAKDDSAQVRLAAAYALARCGEQQHARALVHALTDSPDEKLRAEAAGLLGRLEEPRAVKPLRAALHYPINTKSVHVTLAIQAALAALGDGEGLRELVNQAQGAPEARSIALLLLADLGKPEAADALRYRLAGAKTEYEEARLIAARGLGRLGSSEGYKFALRMATWTDPNKHPTAENPERTFPMRSLAVHALAEIGDPRALPVLRDIAAAPGNPRLQVAAAYAICRIVRH